MTRSVIRMLERALHLMDRINDLYFQCSCGVHACTYMYIVLYKYTVRNDQSGCCLFLYQCKLIRMNFSLTLFV